MLGKPILAYRVNILFRADLSPWVGDREVSMCAITNPVSYYVPCARPASRSPIVWLERASECTTTLDLFGSDFVLLASARESGWCKAAKPVSGSQGLPLQTFRVGPEGDLDDAGDSWATTYGVDDDGALLVRLDGCVAWRCATLKAEPILEIEMALRTALAKQFIQQHQAARQI